MCIVTSKVDGIISSFRDSLEGAMGNDPASPFVKNQIVNRVGSLVVCLASLTAAVIDTGLGIVSAPFGTFNLDAYQFSRDQTVQSQSILDTPLLNFIKVINPNAGFSNDTKTDLPLSKYTLEFFKSLGRSLREPTDHNAIMQFLRSKITPRLMSVVGAVAMVIVRTVEAVFGVLAIPAAILTLGAFEKVNTFACRTLRFTGVIHDITFFAMRFINPQCGLERMRDDTGRLTAYGRRILNPHLYS